MNDAEARKIVAVLMGAFPGSRITPDTIAIYERMVADLDYPTANAAAERLIATCRFMPTIAEIRGACMDLSHGDQRAGGEAWGECLKAIGRFGIYRSPGVDFSFQDPLVARCVAALGWESLCNSENQAADRARFIELYDRLAIGTRRDLNANALPAAERLKAINSTTSEQANDLVLRLAEAKTAKP